MGCQILENKEPQTAGIVNGGKRKHGVVGVARRLFCLHFARMASMGVVRRVTCSLGGLLVQGT